ncbi:nucleotide sugar dehydrogenase [Liquorilactobacillus cacaonum]|uniref:UDP-glucose 6-dehydrogenase n=1 Tax=Liquorilactobacillus cacaonum DSM 21116 TaxID=1423729 RepID=A0A0R2CRX3_9LACO|nr:nucleotide sugar dehydrogenase [Liquorilactobacillus cacaonum]KRM90870.1 UDP-glucose 6-dehydrogenase 2 [Liquorilactobacillus cacaonum DSM 21116]
MTKQKGLKIAVAGTGYVGLSISVLLAQRNEVFAVDINEEKIKLLKENISPIADKEIIEYLATRELNLIPTTNAEKAYKNADFVIIATPTNYDSEKNFFDTSSVKQVIRLVRNYNEKAVIVIKSTVPVGFMKKIKNELNLENIIFSPEFLRESKALYDNLHPSRIIVGTDLASKKEINNAQNFAKLLKDGSLDQDVSTLVMGYNEAEAVKLFSNTYLALRVSYFNELDTYAETKKLNTEQIISGIGLDPRIGTNYNNPSFGYGGYCLPKDTKQLLSNYKDVPQNLIEAIVKSNSTRKKFIAEQILKLIENNNWIKSPVIGIYRLTMKQNSDNFRESSIQGVINELQNIRPNIKILIYEPMLKEQTVFQGYMIEKELIRFKENSNVIVANRFNDELADVRNKVYTRDLFHLD